MDAGQQSGAVVAAAVVAPRAERPATPKQLTRDNPVFPNKTDEISQPVERSPRHQLIGFCAGSGGLGFG